MEEDNFDFSCKKKKKKVKVEEPEDKYKNMYDDMLTRIYDVMIERKIGTRKYLNIPLVKVARDGVMKTAWMNFLVVCQALNRDEQHVREFFCAELSTTTTLDGNENLILSIRCNDNQIQKILNRYINEYVVCPTCKDYSTTLKKVAGIHTIECQSCGASKSIGKIKSGIVMKKN